jgi:2'-phosphotransferase
MGRNHVHFATGLPAGMDVATDAVGGSSEPVISGMRNSSSVLVYVDIAKAMAMGLSFWKSENGVVLSDGGEKKLIPFECFQKVEERGADGGILVADGAVIRDISPGKARKK